MLTEAKKQISRKSYAKNREERLAAQRIYQKTPAGKRNARKSNWTRTGINITNEQYEAMMEDQQALCAICQEPSKKANRSLDVDHDHETGTVRDLLCQSCNMALGLFKERTDLLETAVSYLNYHKVKETAA